MNKSFASGISLIVLLTMAKIANAQFNPQIIDVDGDGVITVTDIEQSIAAYHKRVFSAYDTNGDGQISLEEKSALREARHARHALMLNEFDIDKDGELSAIELDEIRKARLKEISTLFDINKDGTLDVSEQANLDKFLQSRGK